MSGDLPPRIGGKYRPLRLLGKGGMGAVYEVEHEHTGQRLALKILTAQAGASVERFRREARAASLIQSEHIVRVTDADLAPELGGAPYLVMELLEGQDLEHATRDGAQSPETVVEWLRQISRALAKAHEAGLVHRDLKPENVFLTRRDDGTPLVKLLDFGIAKMAAEASSLTASDAFLGTPGYMAPEQTDSRGPPVTFRADLYSLGLITFKLLVGRIYWKDGSLAQLLTQLLADPMPAASARGSTFGPGFDAWFARACDRDPEKRFTSASEQVERLAGALGLPVVSIRSSTPDPEPSTPTRPEGPGVGSLNASVSDLTPARKKTVRRRMLGGSAAALVMAVGTAVALVRGAAASHSNETRATTNTGPLPETGVLGRAAPSPDAQPSSTSIPQASSESVAIAPAASGPGSGTPSPAASGTAKSHHASVAAPAASASSIDASRPKDPLEGPW